MVPGSIVERTAASLTGAGGRHDDRATAQAYYDTTNGNSGGAYRATDVDLEPTTDTGAGYNLMKTRAGEWLHYTVNVSTTGTYTFEARVASVGAGSKFRVTVDGTDVTGAMDVPDTGGWQTWRTVPGNVSAVTGRQTVYLTFSSGQPNDFVNVNWFHFRR